MPEYDVILLRFDSNLNRPELPVPGLQRLFGLDFEAARKVAGSLPCVVRRRAPLNIAARYVEALRSLGAQVELRPCASDADQSDLVSTVNEPPSAGAAVTVKEPGADGVENADRATQPLGTFATANGGGEPEGRAILGTDTVLASADYRPSVIDLPAPPPAEGAANQPSGAVLSSSRDGPSPGATLLLTEGKRVVSEAWSELDSAPSSRVRGAEPVACGHELPDGRSSMELVPIAAGEAGVKPQKDADGRDESGQEAKEPAIPVAPYLSARDRRVITPLASKPTGDPTKPASGDFPANVVYSRRPPPVRLAPPREPLHDDAQAIMPGGRNELPRDSADAFALLDRFRKPGLGDLLAGVTILAAGLFASSSVLNSGQTPRIDYLLDMVGSGWVAVGIYKLMRR